MSIKEQAKKLAPIAVPILTSPVVNFALIAAAVGYYRFTSGHWPTFEQILSGIALAIVRLDRIVAGVMATTTALGKLTGKAEAVAPDEKPQP